MFALIVFAVVAVIGLSGTVVTTARDGYHRIPTRQA